MLILIFLYVSFNKNLMINYPNLHNYLIIIMLIIMWLIIIYLATHILHMYRLPPPNGFGSNGNDPNQPGGGGGCPNEPGGGNHYAYTVKTEDELRSERRKETIRKANIKFRNKVRAERSEAQERANREQTRLGQEVINRIHEERITPIVMGRQWIEKLKREQEQLAERQAEFERNQERDTWGVDSKTWHDDARAEGWHDKAGEDWRK